MTFAKICCIWKAFQCLYKRLHQRGDSGKIAREKTLEIPPQMCYIGHRKGKAIEAATLVVMTVTYKPPSTIRSSWRLFSFVLQNLVNQTYQGDNECTEQEKILVCNHRYPLLSSLVWRVCPSVVEGSRLGPMVFPCR